MVVGCFLFGGRRSRFWYFCWFFVGGCCLFMFRRLVFDDFCSLIVVCCLVVVIRCVLLCLLGVWFTYCWVFVVCCSLLDVWRLLLVDRVYLIAVSVGCRPLFVDCVFVVCFMLFVDRCSPSGA